MSLEEGRRGELGGWEEKKVQEFKAETGRKYTRHLKMAYKSPLDQKKLTKQKKRGDSQWSQFIW